MSTHSGTDGEVVVGSGLGAVQRFDDVRLTGSFGRFERTGRGSDVSRRSGTAEHHDWTGGGRSLSAHRRSVGRPHELLEPLLCEFDDPLVVLPEGVVELPSRPLVETVVIGVGRFGDPGVSRADDTRCVLLVEYARPDDRVLARPTQPLPSSRLNCESSRSRISRSSSRPLSDPVIALWSPGTVINLVRLPARLDRDGMATRRFGRRNRPRWPRSRGSLRGCVRDL